MTRYFENTSMGEPADRSQSASINMDILGKKIPRSSEYTNAFIAGDYYPPEETVAPSDSGELFKHTPGVITISYAYAHPSLRYAVPIALSHVHRKFGVQFEPSELISVDSAGLFNKAKKLGLPVRPSVYSDIDEETGDIEGNPWIGDEEDVENMSSTVPTGPRSRELSPEEVRMAKEHYRSLRNKNGAKEPAQKLGPQFEQLRFDV